MNIAFFFHPSSGDVLLASTGSDQHADVFHEHYHKFGQMGRLFHETFKNDAKDHAQFMDVYYNVQKQEVRQAIARCGWRGGLLTHNDREEQWEAHGFTIDITLRVLREARAQGLIHDRDPA